MTLETWTPERVEQLRSFVVTGLTCSQIAAQIGVTRNAVIGKIHRLGLQPMRSPGAPARLSPHRVRRSRLSPQHQLLRLMFSEGARVSEEATAPVDSAQPCSLLEIAQGKCRWPLGDRAGDCRAADFMFCGNEAITGFSYCAGHARMAYRVPARRRA
jgi:GcrA cell cycle regulator